MEYLFFWKKRVSIDTKVSILIRKFMLTFLLLCFFNLKLKFLGYYILICRSYSTFYSQLLSLLRSYLPLSVIASSYIFVPFWISSCLKLPSNLCIFTSFYFEFPPSKIHFLLVPFPIPQSKRSPQMVLFLISRFFWTCDIQTSVFSRSFEDRFLNTLLIIRVNILVVYCKTNCVPINKSMFGRVGLMT